MGGIANAFTGRGKRGAGGSMKDVSAAGGAWPSKCYMIHGEKLRYYGKFSRRFTKLFNDAYQDYGSFKEK